MPKTISLVFENIPEPTTFALFEKNGTDKVIYRDVAPKGDSVFEHEVPDDWESIYVSYRPKEYYIPGTLSYRKLMDTERTLTLTGDEYYLDVNREKLETEQIQKDIELLIYKPIENLTARQRFYVSIISIQSYFEYLTYGMLVISGHISKQKYRRLSKHEKQTKRAFRVQNTTFFVRKITLCPGKENEQNIIDTVEREAQEKIFHMVRKLRNKVVHSWGYEAINRQDLQTRFSDIGESLDISGEDDTFYNNCRNVFIRLYARMNYIRSQLSLFNEREIIKAERNERGY